jgi:hypothetical protein
LGGQKQERPDAWIDTRGSDAPHSAARAANEIGHPPLCTPEDNTKAVLDAHQQGCGGPLSQFARAELRRKCPQPRIAYEEGREEEQSGDATSLFGHGESNGVLFGVK